MKSQVSMLWRYWPKQVEWFVIGGPARECEAQAVKQEYPGVRCIGFEPNTELYEAQKSGRGLSGTDRPFPGDLYPYALWRNETDPLKLRVPANKGVDIARGSVCRPDNAPDMGEHIIWSEHPVVPRTLDSLSQEFGPFRNAVLWIDIEYAELAALEGAQEFLKDTLLINLETYHHRYLPDINRLLVRQGFMLQGVWNIGESASHDAQDYIYMREVF